MPRHRKAAPEPFLKARAPSREGLVVAVEGLFTWSGLAELCAAQASPVVLGQALSLTAIPGGKATHDTLDSHKMAALLRGGMLPQASVDPAERRGTRALLRRRTHLLRTRAARWSHGQHTHAPDNLPAIGQNIAYQAHRGGVTARLHDPAGQKTSEGALALITYADERLRDVELSLLNTAKQHEAQTLYGLQTVPGLGKLRSLVRLDEIHAIGRFPSGQACASYARLVTCRKASAGTRLGPSGKTSGNAHLQGAFSDAATLCLRHNPHGQTLLPRVEKKHGTGKALTSLAHTLARAVYSRRKRQPAFEITLVLRASRSRAGEPAVSLDTPGMRLKPARCLSCLAASWNAPTGRGPVSQSPYV